MGLRGCVQLWLGQGEVPELGPLWSPAGERTGLPPVPEGLQPQQFALSFSLFSRWTSALGSIPFLGEQGVGGGPFLG